MKSNKILLVIFFILLLFVGIEAYLLMHHDTLNKITVAQNENQYQFIGKVISENDTPDTIDAIISVSNSDNLPVQQEFVMMVKNSSSVFLLSNTVAHDITMQLDTTNVSILNKTKLANTLQHAKGIDFIFVVPTQSSLVFNQSQMTQYSLCNQQFIELLKKHEFTKSLNCHPLITAAGIYGK